MDRLYFNQIEGGKAAPFVVKENGDKYPLPFNNLIELEGEWLVKFSLTSTAGGGADWELAKKASSPEFLSLGYYCPTWTGIVSNPKVLWVTHSYPYGYDTKEFLVREFFKPGFSWFVAERILYGERVKPLPERKMLCKLYKKYLPLFQEEDATWIYKQGHLEIKSIPDVKLPEERDYSVKELFNHQLLGGVIVARARIEDYGVALAKFWKRGWIVSPDHLNEAIQLHEGWYLLRHPMPTDGDVD